MKHLKTSLYSLIAILTLTTNLVKADMPNYATPPAYSTPNTIKEIKGRVSNIDTKYEISVQDEDGYIDHIKLYDGTIINPTGLTLAPGMVVNIYGYPTGYTFTANEIDTPYALEASGYYYDGHVWDYYGNSYGLDFYFNNYGWWHRGIYRNWNGRNYQHRNYYGNTVRVNNSVHIHESNHVSMEEHRH